MIDLIIARHADAAWGRADASDHDRPLSARGRSDANRMAQVIGALERAPRAIIASSARRAQETAKSYAAVLGLDLRTEDRLYGADPATLLAVARENGETAVLLVAHDPGLSSLAFAMTQTVASMPTASVLRATWDAEGWTDALRRSPDTWSFHPPHG